MGRRVEAGPQSLLGFGQPGLGEFLAALYRLHAGATPAASMKQCMVNATGSMRRCRGRRRNPTLRSVRDRWRTVSITTPG
jgi:hypothetical protein